MITVRQISLPLIIKEQIKTVLQHAMLQKVYAGSGNEAILTQMDFYGLQHKKAQIFVTSNAVIKNMSHSTVDDYNFICKQRV